MTDAEVDDINQQASELIKRGVSFMNEARREAPIDALHCFDEALELRRRVGADRSPLQGYLLSACLINRGDALVQMGGPGPIAAALASYDEAVAVLRGLPLAEDPRYPRQLALALQNRALALQARGEDADADLAAAAFTEALAVLDDDRSHAIEDGAYVRAVVWLNVANLYVMLESGTAHARARDAAMHALDAVATLETSDPNAAAAGLQARHVLCRLCARSLSQAADDGDPMPADVHEATDAVDDGLELVRTWEQRGMPYFRPFALDLFRFGARVYARYQPQFLDEFIDENMNAASSSANFVESPEMVMAAHEARGLLPNA